MGASEIPFDTPAPHGMPRLVRAAVRSSLAALLALAAAPSARLDAQQPDSARASRSDGGRAPCAYDACAFRLEDDRLVQGALGTEVARLGIFTAPMRGVAWSSDSARVQAARFSSRYANARGLKTGAVFGSAVATILLVNAEEGSSNRDAIGPAVLLVASSVLSIVGQQIENSARRQLSRAIWWHNRELPR